MIGRNRYSDAKPYAYHPRRDRVTPKWQREPDLFPETVYPNVPGARHEKTSQEAGEKIKPHMGRMERLTVDCIVTYGEQTADEIAQRLRKKRGNIAPRCTMLWLRGILQKTGRTRKNEDGNSAIVWALAEGYTP